MQRGRTELREPLNILSLTWRSANGIHKNPPDSKPGNTTTLLPGERFIYSIAQMHTDTNALSSSITAYIPWYPVYWVYTLVPYILDPVYLYPVPCILYPIYCILCVIVYFFSSVIVHMGARGPLSKEMWTNCVAVSCRFGMSNPNKLNYTRLIILVHM